MKLSQTDYINKMYTKFFGFRENPFKTSPDSAYFFPGQSHEEALAHLRYAISQEEGFISITGEKGTGKTTICIALLENLDEKHLVAFIPNAEQSPKRLIKRINKELGIKARTDNMKDLNDALNEFLMQKRIEKKKIVFLLDDAHMLARDVLEQIRLLSNLETNREKLLQIVLVGRPELTDMLSSYELRQIGQRVSVSYHLNPLDEYETLQYIMHRTMIAGKGAIVKFDQTAIEYIYKYSDGIPLVINSVCDSVLLASYKLGQKHVSGDVAKAAIKEMPGRSESRWDTFYRIGRIRLLGIVCALLLIISLTAIYLLKGTNPKIASKTAQSKMIEENINRSSQQKTSTSVEDKNIPNTDIEAIDGRLDGLYDPQTYAIQFGAFVLIENAQDAIKRLEAKGYKAQIVTLNDSKGKIWHTVRIGNYASHEIARKKAESISAREKIETVVRPSKQL